MNRSAPHRAKCTSSSGGKKVSHEASVEILIAKPEIKTLLKKVAEIPPNQRDHHATLRAIRRRTRGMDLPPITFNTNLMGLLVDRVAS